MFNVSGYKLSPSHAVECLSLSNVKQVFIILLAGFALACNPFAPALDTSDEVDFSLIGDPTTVDGVFQNIRYAYTFRDTTIYGQLLAGDYSFVYRDYDRGVDVSWGRDEEMRTTHGLFQNVQ